MGNLCSIFHSRFKHLIRVIPSTRKAQLMDYILLGWQTSTYKLRSSDKKWFMKPYAEIVSDTGIPKSTLERYIKELSDAGFIERRQALFSRTGEHGKFEIKKGNYINITDKLLDLLQFPPLPVNEELPVQEEEHNKDNESSSASQRVEEDIPQESTNFDNNEGIDPLKMRGLYIRDLYRSSLSNINLANTFPSVDKATTKVLLQQFESVKSFLFSDIKEEIPQVVKKLVSGTFFNLTFKHLKQLSSPKQLVAEYLFALLNVDYYLPKVSCFKHRNNILAKMLRSNQWRTPKGFYHHFYLGQQFKDKQDLRDKHWQQKKEAEIKGYPSFETRDESHDERLIMLEAKMLEKSCLIEELTQSIYHQVSEEIIEQLRARIQTLRKELDSLWSQQRLIEQEIENEFTESSLQRCA